MHIYSGKSIEMPNPAQYIVFHAQYLCDGAADCIDGYDEDTFLCTAGRDL